MRLALARLCWQSVHMCKVPLLRLWTYCEEVLLSDNSKLNGNGSGEPRSLGARPLACAHVHVELTPCPKSLRAGLEAPLVNAAFVHLRVALKTAAFARTKTAELS